MIRYSTPARVSILGAPSDGYGGRTLALAVPAFAATVTLVPAEGVVIDQNDEDKSEWASLAQLVDHVDRYGYATGPQLLSAAVRTFVDVARSIDAADALGGSTADGFRLSYQSSIPRQTGLAGSSALVVSALRCLCSHTGLEIPDHLLASIALRVETEQLDSQPFLDRTTGLQDAVVQALGGAVAMNFGAMEVDAKYGVAFGHYEAVETSLLPPLFLAYRKASAEPSTTYRGDLRARFESGESSVRDTMKSLAGLVAEGVASLRWGDHERFGVLVAQNTELRRGLGPPPAGQFELVDLADSLEAPATFAGWGDSVVGVYRDVEHLATLEAAYGHLEAEVVALTPTGLSKDG